MPRPNSGRPHLRASSYEIRDIGRAAARRGDNATLRACISELRNYRRTRLAASVARELETLASKLPYESGVPAENRNHQTESRAAQSIHADKQTGVGQSPGADRLSGLAKPRRDSASPISGYIDHLGRWLNMPSGELLSYVRDFRSKLWAAAAIAFLVSLLPFGSSLTLFVAFLAAGLATSSFVDELFFPPLPEPLARRVRITNRAVEKIQHLYAELRTDQKTIYQTAELLGDRVRNYVDAKASYSLSLPIGALECRLVSPGLIENLVSKGYRTIDQLPSDLRCISGVGEKRAVQIQQRIASLERDAHDAARKDALRIALPSLVKSPPPDIAKSVLCELSIAPTWADKIGKTEKLIDSFLSDARPLQDRLDRRSFRRDGSRVFESSLQALERLTHDNCEYLEKELATVHEPLRVLRDKLPNAATHLTQMRSQFADLLSKRFASFLNIGGLAETVAREVEQTRFDAPLKNVRLRPYQTFGAKFVIAKKRILLGDEMGLGKTLQAIAVAAHVHNERPNSRSIIVAPPSLLENWRRELVRSAQFSWNVYRPGDPITPISHWKSGGALLLGYTSFTTKLVPKLPNNDPIDLLVVDEAHYVKNPSAIRTKAVREIAKRSEKVLFMTGTPLENRLPELVNLVDVLQPKALTRKQKRDAEDGIASATELNSALAPVYLRRRIDDVLLELPERVEIDEWVELSRSDRIEYREAALARQWHRLRRTATLGDSITLSAKLSRLQEILEEYQQVGEKVLVFSYYLDVLKAAMPFCDGARSIDGSIPQSKRQDIIDSFCATEGFACIVAQIQTGGLGLNLQAASGVIILEPQIKPSMEAQAIARAHRMGQSKTVRVHRMLVRNSIEERLREVLAKKQAIFDAYVDESILKAVGRSASLTSELDQADEEQLIKRLLEEEFAAQR